MENEYWYSPTVKEKDELSRKTALKVTQKLINLNSLIVVQFNFLIFEKCYAQVVPFP